MERAAKVHRLMLLGAALFAASLPSASGAELRPERPTDCSDAPATRGIGKIEHRASRLYPFSYGSLWLLRSEGREERVAVAFTKRPRERAADAAAGYCRPDLVVPVRVEYSVHRLRRIQSVMIDDRGAPPRRRPDGLPRLYNIDIDVIQNRIEVTVKRKRDGDFARFRELYGPSVFVFEGELGGPERR